jgi:hypothetical protein
MGLSGGYGGLGGGGQQIQERPAYGPGVAPEGYIPGKTGWQLGEPAKADIFAKYAGANLAQQNLDFNRQKFGAIAGALGGAMANFGGGAATPGGQSPASPEIGVRGVWDPQQVDQQVNAARASNDASTASRVRSAEAANGAAGFGPNSPLLMALRQGFQNQNLMANADAGRQIRTQAAQQNSDAIFKQQQARESQFASRQSEDIQRRTPYFQTQNALISALAGLA